MSKSTSKQKTDKRKRTGDTAVVSLYEQTPVWGFSLLDFSHKEWSLSANIELLPDIFKYLGGLERMGARKWRDILSNKSGRRNNTRNHFIKVDEMCRVAQKRLTELNLDDYDELVSIAINSLTRIWGIVDECGVFYILWIDPKHEIYAIE